MENIFAILYIENGSWYEQGIAFKTERKALDYINKQSNPETFKIQNALLHADGNITYPDAKIEYEVDL